MTIDPQAAADALRSVEETERRARTLRGYRAASSSFLIWGVAWFVANVLCDLFPTRVGTIWISTDVIAVAACAVAAWRSPGDKQASLRWLAAFSVLVVIVFALYTVMRPSSSEQNTAVISILVAYQLTLAGVFALGARFVVLGILLAVAIAVGYWLLPDHRFLWFAFSGGGALLLAGFWMRKA